MVREAILQCIVMEYCIMLQLDKVAVVIQIEQYAKLTEEYQLLDVPFGPKIAGIRYVVCSF